MPELFSTTNISSHLEIDELKQKLSDAEGDIKVNISQSFVIN